MAEYLVTGGAGFIGSHIVEALVSEGEGVRVLDNFSTGHRENIRPFRSKIEVIESDIRDKDAVREAVSGVDYVIHQAALASVQRSIDDPATTDAVNVGGTLNLLDAARRAEVKAFVYASSSSVYGDSEVLPKEERMTPNPMSPYAVSKLAGEYYCRVFGGVFGLRTVSLRYFNVFGPRQDPDSPYAAVIPIFLKALFSGKAPTIYGDGEQSRDFTFVSNVVQANLLSCRGAQNGPRVYNVACGDRFSLNTLYGQLQEITNVRQDPLFGPPRRGDVKHSQAAIAAIASELGYRAAVSFEEGLRRTVEWYRDNR